METLILRQEHDATPLTPPSAVDRMLRQAIHVGQVRQTIVRTAHIACRQKERRCWVIIFKGV